MLAARDQENLVHARQTTAAGKHLNQNIRALHPKTPFHSARHDENQPVESKGQKTVGKDGPTELGKSAFVTPLAPRNRAPLGAKTSNVKAHAFQTPGPAPLTVKPGKTVQKHSTGRRSGRSKITIAPSELVGTNVLARHIQEDEPDFGYAPPPVDELPDPPLEIEEDPLLTQELLAGYGRLYPSSPKDEKGRSLRLKREEEEYQKYQREREQRSIENEYDPVFTTTGELNKKVDAMIASGPKKTRLPLSRVNTMQARSAAAALSDSQLRLPAAAMKQTQASEQKKKALLPAIKPKSAVTPQIPSSRRPGPAAVSKNTIGFPKAKKAPSIIPKGVENERPGNVPTTKPVKIDQASVHPRDFRALYGSPPEESDMWFRLKAFELLEEDVAKEDGDDLADELFETGFFPFDNSKLDDDDFQLPVPE